MTSRTKTVMLLAALTSCCLAHAVHATEIPVRLPDDVKPTRYTLELALDPAQDTFEGVVSIELDFAARTQRFWLHALDMTFRQATLTPHAGAGISAEVHIASADGTAQVTLERAVPAGKATLEVSYAGRFNPLLNGLYVARSHARAYVASQMEPIGARRVLPCFDEPRFKVPFTVSLVVPNGLQAITNAVATDTQMASDGRTRHRFAPTAPLPTYLLAFLAGPYDIAEGRRLAANELRKQPVPLRGVAASGKADRLATALSDTPAIVEHLERYFGVPYRYGKLDLIAVPAFPGGAMENAGAIVYREPFLLVPPNAARKQWRAYFTTHAHELAHQWFGNYVTPAWWEDLWLNESFATWLGNKTAHALRLDSAFDRDTIVGALSAMETDSLAHVRRVREPIVRNETITSAFDSITYEKGAGVLAMIEAYMGETRFRDGVRLYMRKYPDGVATSDQFFEALAGNAADPGVLEALRSFVEQPHIPMLQVEMQCAGGSAPIVRITQAPYRAVGSTIETDRSWVIPFSFAYETRGRRARVQTLLRERRSEITLKSPQCPVWLLPNAAGAGYWRFNLEEARWRELLAAFATLTPGEQLVMLDSLSAAFRANAVSAQTYVHGFEIAAGASAWDVVLAAARELGEGAVSRTLPDPAPLRSRLVALLGNRGLELVKSQSTSGEERTLRAELARLLVSRGRDRRLIEHLGSAVASRGYAAVGADADLYAASAGAAVALADGKLSNGLLEAALAEPDQAKRADVLVGIAGSVTPGSLEPVLASIPDKKIAAQDLLPVLRALVRNPETREATWSWMKAHPEVLAAQVPELFKYTLPNVAAAFCDSKMVSQLEDFFKVHGNAFPGHERALAQTTEQIRICAALRALRADQLRAALLSG